MAMGSKAIFRLAKMLSRRMFLEKLGRGTRDEVRGKNKIQIPINSIVAAGIQSLVIA
jgi:hypothetical protein